MFLNKEKLPKLLFDVNLNRKHEMFLNRSDEDVKRINEPLNRKHEMFLNALGRLL